MKRKAAFKYQDMITAYQSIPVIERTYGTPAGEFIPENIQANLANLFNAYKKHTDSVESAECELDEKTFREIDIDMLSQTVGKPIIVEEFEKKRAYGSPAKMYRVICTY